MDIQYEPELKFSNELAVGDQLKIGELLCEITKVEDIFHYVPKSRIRLSLTIAGASPKNSKAVLFLPAGLPIETLK